MSAIAFLRTLLDKGIALDVAMQAAEAYEASPPRSKGAVRQERYRKAKASQASRVTHSDDSVTKPLPLSPSPKPLSTIPNQLPPIVPQTATKKPALDEPFERFWLAYPNKTAKRAAKLAFGRAEGRIAAPVPVEVMLAAIERAKKTRKWRDGFVPNPTTWLNGDCWEDGQAVAGPDPPQAITPEAHALRLQHYTATGEWRSEWGDRPKAQAA